MQHHSPLVLAGLLAIATPVGAFPSNGSYFDTCAADGGPTPDAVEARLDFPELCFDGACCDLYNPTRLRGLTEEFLYDGTCTAGEDTFEARIYFGEGPDEGSMVVVLRGMGATLYDCAAPAAVPADAATEPAAADPAPAPSTPPETEEEG